MNAAPPVRVSGLRTAFGDTVIHQDLNLEVCDGEILGLVGGSGTGKSVLMETILGLRTPASGSIELFGCDIHQRDDRAAVERRLGVMFQNGALFSTLTVQENVEAPFREHTGLPDAFVHDLAALKIKLTGLPDNAGAKKPAELSGGMKKRAGIARALALDPDLLFLDEPTSGLDPIAAEEIDTLIRRFRDALGLTVVMITHDIDSLFANCDRVAVLADRKVAAIGPPTEVARSEHPWIREYFGGARGRAAQKADG